MSFNDVLGWYGTIAILAAYFLNSAGLIDSTSSRYQLLNLTGAIGICVVCIEKSAIQPAALEGVWALIALGALLRKIKN